MRWATEGSDGPLGRPGGGFERRAGYVRFRPGRVQRFPGVHPTLLEWSGLALDRCNACLGCGVVLVLVL